MSQNRKAWSIGAGARLSGTARVHGNKNAALPCMAAALLLPIGGRLNLENVPRISDVASMADILAVYGVTSSWTGPSSLSLRHTSYPSEAPEIPADLASRIRGSIVLLGALAAQYPFFSLSKPGGDKIGGRPITAHLAALNDLGLSVAEGPGVLTVRRLTPDLRGGTCILSSSP